VVKPQQFYFEKIYGKKEQIKEKVKRKNEE
jgi:hypothetical protein